MEPDPVTELSQNLKAGGSHPSQTDPVLLHERGDIFPHVEVPKPLVHFVRTTPPEVVNAFARRLTD